jgi:PAS domain S-box-containing protein
MFHKWTDAMELRHLAEEAAIGRTWTADFGVTSETLLHELSVHRAELEMQNEALREAQTELESAAQRYRELFEAAPVGYVLLDRSCTIKLANARAAELLGQPLPRLIGTRLSHYLPPEEAIEFERYRREVARSKKDVGAEFTVRAEGALREVNLHGVCTDPETGDWRVTLSDVTAHNVLARKLGHSERLGTLGRHASVVAHDLNNLLHGVFGHADMALRSLGPDHAAYSAVVRLREVVARCAESTTQLATYTRSEPNQPPLVDLNETIRAMDGLLQSLLGDEIALDLHLAAEDGVVRMDAAQVEQIVLTAVRNARQAMPHGGTFTIETACLHDREAAQQHGVEASRCLRWSMSDTGIGMTAGTRNRAFEPFFTTKPAGMGTGLGLSLVAAAVDRAGGAVTLESELGRGANLIVYLPLMATVASGGPEIDATEVTAMSTVVLVRDEARRGSGVAEALKNAGCSVALIGSGNDALELLGGLGNRLNVLLIDQAVPEMVIGELIRRAEELAPFAEIVVRQVDDSTDDERERRKQTENTVKVVVAAANRQSAQ